MNCRRAAQRKDQWMEVGIALAAVELTLEKGLAAFKTAAPRRPRASLKRVFVGWSKRLTPLVDVPVPPDVAAALTGGSRANLTKNAASGGYTCQSLQFLFVKKPDKPGVLVKPLRPDEASFNKLCVRARRTSVSLPRWGVRVSKGDRARAVQVRARGVRCVGALPPHRRGPHPVARGAAVWGCRRRRRRGRVQGTGGGKGVHRGGEAAGGGLGGGARGGGGASSGGSSGGGSGRCRGWWRWWWRRRRGWRTGRSGHGWGREASVRA